MSMNSTFYKDNADLQGNPAGEMSIDGSLIEKESPPPQYVTHRSRTAGEGALDLRAEFRSFQASMKECMTGLFERQNEKFTKLIDDVENMKASMQFISDRYDQLNSQAEEFRGRMSVLEDRVVVLETKDNHILELENKIETLELNSRQCNIEIANLLERRNENLINILENIANLIKQPIVKHEIVAIHRVGQMNPDSTRPKNIIVRFTSRIIRDNFLAAARLAKTITTDQLQIPGNPRKIYVNEHLTLNRKALFRETREVAKNAGFKFIWIKHGTILVRRNETSPVFAVRSKNDLSKLKTK